MLFKNYSTSLLTALLANNGRAIIIYRILGNVFWLFGRDLFSVAIQVFPTAAYSLEICAYRLQGSLLTRRCDERCSNTSTMLAINQTVTLCLILL